MRLVAVDDDGFVARPLVPPVPLLEGAIQHVEQEFLDGVGVVVDPAETQGPGAQARVEGRVDLVHGGVRHPHLVQRQLALERAQHRALGVVNLFHALGHARVHRGILEHPELAQPVVNGDDFALVFDNLFVEILESERIEFVGREHRGDLDPEIVKGARDNVLETVRGVIELPPRGHVLQEPLGLVRPHVLDAGRDDFAPLPCFLGLGRELVVTALHILSLPCLPGTSPASLSPGLTR